MAKKKNKSGGGKLLIKDDCLAPQKTLSLTYEGPNTMKIATQTSAFFSNFFKVSSAGWAEQDFRFDNSGDNLEFYARWWVRKSMSAYSELFWEITVQGEENKNTKKGRFSLVIDADVEHRFPENWALRGIFWMYHYLLYDRLRRDWIKRCSELAYGFRELLKQEFGIIKSPKKSVETFQ